MDRLTAIFNRGANGEAVADTGCKTSDLDRAYRLGTILRCSATRVWAGRGHTLNVQTARGKLSYSFAADEQRPSLVGNIDRLLTAANAA